MIIILGLNEFLKISYRKKSALTKNVNIPCKVSLHCVEDIGGRGVINS